MKKGILFITLALAVWACKKSDTTTAPSSQLKNCRIEYLYFRDGITILPFQSLIFDPVGADNQVCSYTYEDGMLTRVRGGFVPRPAGTNLSNYIFSSTGYDSVFSGGDSVTVDLKWRDSQGGVHPGINTRFVYYMNSDHRLVRIGSRGSPPFHYFDLYYTYSGDSVTETLGTGEIRRKFYFENDNLVRIVQDRYQSNGKIFSRDEILLQGYDNHPNPFRYRYYVKGAFFRAFSANNYSSYTANYYEILHDSTLGITGMTHCTFPFTYNEQGWPLFGDYE